MKTSCGVLFFFTRSGSDLSKFIHLHCRTAVGLGITKKLAGQAGDFLFIRTNQIQSAYSTKIFYCVHYVPQRKINCIETKGKIESQCIFCFDMYTKTVDWTAKVQNKDKHIKFFWTHQLISTLVGSKHSRFSRIFFYQR